jgi:hypothetical protein
MPDNKQTPPAEPAEFLPQSVPTEDDVQTQSLKTLFGSTEGEPAPIEQPPVYDEILTSIPKPSVLAKKLEKFKDSNKRLLIRLGQNSNVDSVTENGSNSPSGMLDSHRTRYKNIDYDFSDFHLHPKSSKFLHDFLDNSVSHHELFLKPKTLDSFEKIVDFKLKVKDKDLESTYDPVYDKEAFQQYSYNLADFFEAADKNSPLHNLVEKEIAPKKLFFNSQNRNAVIDFVNKSSHPSFLAASIFHKNVGGLNRYAKSLNVDWPEVFEHMFFTKELDKDYYEYTSYDNQIDDFLKDNPQAEEDIKQASNFDVNEDSTSLQKTLYVLQNIDGDKFQNILSKKKELRSLFTDNEVGEFYASPRRLIIEKFSSQNPVDDEQHIVDANALIQTGIMPIFNLVRAVGALTERGPVQYVIGPLDDKVITDHFLDPNYNSGSLSDGIYVNGFLLSRLHDQNKPAFIDLMNSPEVGSNSVFEALSRTIGIAGDHGYYGYKTYPLERKQAFDLFDTSINHLGKDQLRRLVYFSHIPSTVRFITNKNAETKPMTVEENKSNTENTLVKMAEANPSVFLKGDNNVYGELEHRGMPDVGSRVYQRILSMPPDQLFHNPMFEFSPGSVGANMLDYIDVLEQRKIATLPRQHIDFLVKKATEVEVPQDAFPSEILSAIVRILETSATLKNFDSEAHGHPLVNKALQAFDEIHHRSSISLALSDFYKSLSEPAMKQFKEPVDKFLEGFMGRMLDGIIKDAAANNFYTPDRAPHQNKPFAGNPVLSAKYYDALVQKYLEHDNLGPPDSQIQKYISAATMSSYGQAYSDDIVLNAEKSTAPDLFLFQKTPVMRIPSQLAVFSDNAKASVVKFLLSKKNKNVIWRISANDVSSHQQFVKKNVIFPALGAKFFEPIFENYTSAFPTVEEQLRSIGYVSEAMETPPKEISVGGAGNISKRFLIELMNKFPESKITVSDWNAQFHSEININDENDSVSFEDLTRIFRANPPKAIEVPEALSYTNRKEFRVNEASLALVKRIYDQLEKTPELVSNDVIFNNLRAAFSGLDFTDFPFHRLFSVPGGSRRTRPELGSKEEFVKLGTRFAGVDFLKNVLRTEDDYEVSTLPYHIFEPYLPQLKSLVDETKFFPSEGWSASSLAGLNNLLSIMNKEVYNKKESSVFSYDFLDYAINKMAIDVVGESHEHYIENKDTLIVNPKNIHNVLSRLFVKKYLRPESSFDSLPKQPDVRRLVAASMFENFDSLQIESFCSDGEENKAKVGEVLSSLLDENGEINFSNLDVERFIKNRVYRYYNSFLSGLISSVYADAPAEKVDKAFDTLFRESRHDMSSFMTDFSTDSSKYHSAFLRFAGKFLNTFFTDDKALELNIRSFEDAAGTLIRRMFESDGHFQTYADEIYYNSPKTLIDQLNHQFAGLFDGGGEIDPLKKARRTAIKSAFIEIFNKQKGHFNAYLDEMQKALIEISKKTKIPFGIFNDLSSKDFEDLESEETKNIIKDYLKFQEGLISSIKTIGEIKQLHPSIILKNLHLFGLHDFSEFLQDASNTNLKSKIDPNLLKFDYLDPDKASDYNLIIPLASTYGNWLSEVEKSDLPRANKMRYGVKQIRLIWDGFYQAYTQKVKPSHFAKVKSAFMTNDAPVSFAHRNKVQPSTDQRFDGEYMRFLTKVSQEVLRKFIETESYKKHWPDFNEKRIQRDANGELVFILNRGVSGDFAYQLLQSMGHISQTGDLLDHKDIEGNLVTVSELPFSSYAHSFGASAPFANRRDMRRADGSRQHMSGVVFSQKIPISRILLCEVLGLGPGFSHTHITEREWLILNPLEQLVLKPEDVMSYSLNGTVKFNEKHDLFNETQRGGHLYGGELGGED